MSRHRLLKNRASKIKIAIICESPTNGAHCPIRRNTVTRAASAITCTISALFNDCQNKEKNTLIALIKHNPLVLGSSPFSVCNNSRKNNNRKNNNRKIDNSTAVAGDCRKVLLKRFVMENTMKEI